MCSTYPVSKFFVGELPYELTSYRSGTGSENQHNTAFLPVSIVKSRSRCNFIFNSRNIQNAGQREHDEQPDHFYSTNVTPDMHGMVFDFVFGMLIVYI